MTRLWRGLGVGIKVCWGPKGGDLIKKMKVIPCGPPSLLPQLSAAEGGRATAGEGTPLRGGSSAQPAFPEVLPGAPASEEAVRSPQGKGPLLRSPQ